jgi:hypothetical protein
LNPLVQIPGDATDANNKSTLYIKLALEEETTRTFCFLV